MSPICVFADSPVIRDKCSSALGQRPEKITLSARGAFSRVSEEKTEISLAILQVTGLGREESDQILRFQKAYPSVPLIVINGCYDEDLECRAFRMGVFEFLNEDFIPEQLANAVRRSLDERSAASLKSISGDTGEEKIMVVDDEEDIRNLIATFLEHKKYKVIKAKNGKEAIEKVQTDKPRNILLDVCMPGMDGIETLRKIRQVDPEVGVIMVTGVGDEKVAEQAAALGSYHFIHKPFQLKYLEMVLLTRLASS